MATMYYESDADPALIAGRKVAGILGESSDGRVVLGTGINVNVQADELPADVQIPATSLLAETGGPVDRIELLVEFLAALERKIRPVNEVLVKRITLRVDVINAIVVFPIDYEQRVRQGVGRVCVVGDSE